MTVPSQPFADTPFPVTCNTFLGDRLQILQPATGYRAGVDAVLLASAVLVRPDSASKILDCGAGVGTVGLCIAARCPTASVTLVEREEDLVELARRNVSANHLHDRVCVVPGDITVAASNVAAPRLAAESFDCVVANPPFHDDAGGTHATDPLKRVSRAMRTNALQDWVRFAARLAKPSACFTVIHKSEALPGLIEAMRDRFGALAITPVHAFAGKPAIRVLVSGVKGSRAPLSLLPSIVLHEPGGAFTPYVSRILRQGAPLISSN